MKRLSFFLLIGACMLPPLQGSAQTEKRSTFQLTFFPPLSTNGREAARYTNTVSFNLLAGISKNEEAVTFGGLGNLILNNSDGVQFAGLANAVGNNGEGVLFSGLLNVAKYYGGVQFAGLVNTSKVIDGLQFAGLTNITTGMSGFQFAGLMNVTQDVYGVQLAGLANVATRDVEGSQLAGLVNIVKRVDGVQLGFLNIAEESDTPIGFLNLIRNGKKSLGVTYNEIGSTIASFRSGGRHTYGILGAGYNHKAKGGSFVTLAGLGASVRCTSWLSIDNELTGESIGDFRDGAETFRTGYTLLPSFSIGGQRAERPIVEIFAGPGIYYMHSEKPENIDLFPKHSLWKKHGASKLQQVHVGYLLGVRDVF
jgi:hypothetical protein